MNHARKPIIAADTQRHRKSPKRTLTASVLDPPPGRHQEDNAMNAPKPILTLDVDKYQHYLDNSDLSEAEKRELLETLWNIVCEFVSLGFGVHPLQQIMGNACGKDSQDAGITGFLSEGMLKCLDPEILTNAAEAEERKGVRK